MSTCPKHGSYQPPLDVFGVCPYCNILRELFVTTYERDTWEEQCKSRSRKPEAVQLLELKRDHITLLKVADGYKAERDELLARLKIVESVTGSGTWVWSDTPADDLASMSDAMVLTMTAGQLRQRLQTREVKP